MKNTIVKVEGKLKGEEFFNAQFCPAKEDVLKAMKKFFDFFMPNDTPDSDLEKIIKGMTEQQQPFNIELNEDNWMQMSFDKI